MNITALVMATLVAALVIVIEAMLRRMRHWNPAARYNYVIGVATVMAVVGATYGLVSGDWPPVVASWLLYGPAFIASGIMVLEIHSHGEYEELQREYRKLQAKVEALEANGR